MQSRPANPRRHGPPQGPRPGLDRPALLPDQDPQPRELHPPSTAATLNLAATAAQAARLYPPFDAGFAERCLTAARTAWKAAQDHPAMYAPRTTAPAAAPTTTPTSATSSTGPPPNCSSPPANSPTSTHCAPRRTGPATLSAAAAPTGSSTAALGRLDLATVPNHCPRPQHRPHLRAQRRRRLPENDPGAGVRRPASRERLHLGIQQRDPQQARGHRHRVRHHRRPAVPRRGPRRPRLHPRPQRAQPVLRDRLRHPFPHNQHSRIYAHHSTRRSPTAARIDRRRPEPRPGRPEGAEDPPRTRRRPSRSSATSTTSSPGPPTRSRSTGTQPCPGSPPSPSTRAPVPSRTAHACSPRRWSSPWAKTTR